MPGIPKRFVRIGGTHLGAPIWGGCPGVRLGGTHLGSCLLPSRERVPVPIHWLAQFLFEGVEAGKMSIMIFPLPAPRSPLDRSFNQALCAFMLSLSHDKQDSSQAKLKPGLGIAVEPVSSCVLSGWVAPIWNPKVLERLAPLVA